MDANEKSLTLFQTRVRQMILKFSELKKENEELYAMVDQKEAEVKNWRPSSLRRAMTIIH